MSKKITVVPAGGLANRMRAIASGASLAAETGIPCEVKWRVNDELKAEFDTLFTPAESCMARLTVKSIKSLPVRLLLEPPRKLNLNLPALLHRWQYGMCIYDGEKADLYSDHPETLLREVRKAPKGAFIFSSGILFPVRMDIYRNLFRFSSEVEERAREISRGVERFDYGIHIRQTDNALSIAGSPVSLFESRIEELLEKNPELHFYLATDSQEVKQRLADRFGESITYNPVAADRKSREGMIDGGAEMLLLSRSGKILGSYWSSYSEAAAMLGDVPLEILSI